LAHGDERNEALESLANRLLHDDSADVRADAALALADGEARGMLDALIEASRDAHERVRQMAVLALGELSPRGHREACRVIEAALDDDSGALRFQALIALRKLDVHDAEARLTRAVVDADARVRYIALRLIDEFLAESSRDFTDVPEPVRKACAQALEDAEVDVRIAAAFLFAKEGDARAAQVLIEGLTRGVRLPAPEDEQELIELAGELGLRAAEPGLIRHAWGRLGLVPGRFAWQAKVALARIGNARAQNEILKGLSSWNRDTRTLSVVAVGRAGLSQARARLEQMSRDESVDPSVIRAALREIG
jgi:HEAT repeat protein